MMIEKVISGGQTGADIAGLRAAKASGIKTGGYIPRWFKTLEGSKPEYAEEYGLIEFGDSYRPRTIANVSHSDITIAFAYNWNSPGERLTRSQCIAYDKPYVPINFRKGAIHESYIEYNPEHLFAGIVDRNWNVINIAGNSEKTAPGIEEAVYNFLYSVFNCDVEVNT